MLTGQNKKKEEPNKNYRTKLKNNTQVYIRIIKMLMKNLAIIFQMINTILKKDIIKAGTNKENMIIAIKRTIHPAHIVANMKDLKRKHISIKKDIQKIVHIVLHHPQTLIVEVETKNIIMKANTLHKANTETLIIGHKGKNNIIVKEKYKGLLMKDHTNVLKINKNLMAMLIEKIWNISLDIIDKKVPTITETNKDKETDKRTEITKIMNRDAMMIKNMIKGNINLADIQINM